MDTILIADYFFSDENLFYRKKIVYLSIEDIESLCLYFKVGNSFYVSHYFDFLELTDNSKLTEIKRILSKNEISISDLTDLLFLFDNNTSLLSNEEAAEIITEEFHDLNLNEIYFSL
jgi:hypothetical protein